MKKFIAMIFTAIVFSLSLFGCSSVSEEDAVIKGYADKQAYNDNGTNGQLSFTKYTYDTDVKDDYQKDENYIQVNTDNNAEIAGYFQHYNEWVKISSFKDKYDFTSDMITTGDLYYVTDDVVSDDNIGQRKERRVYKMYSIYYYDTESNILYYIFNDIRS